MPAGIYISYALKLKCELRSITISNSFLSRNQAINTVQQQQHSFQIFICDDLNMCSDTSITYAEQTCTNEKVRSSSLTNIICCGRKSISFCCIVKKILKLQLIVYPKLDCCVASFSAIAKAFVGRINRGYTLPYFHRRLQPSGETSTLGQGDQIAVVGARVKTVKYMTSSCSFNLGTTFLQHSFPYKLRPNPRPPALC